MLTRLLHTMQQINLGIHIIRILSNLDLIPALRRCPPSCLAMTQDLLIDIQYMKMCRDTLNPIRLIDLRIDLLKMLKHVRRDRNVRMFAFSTLTDVSFVVAKCSSV